MNEKLEAIIVVPDDLIEMSMSAIRLCELFIAKVLDATDTVIEVKVDGKSRAVISGTQSIKELVSMYLNSGRLASFYKQLIALATKNVASDELVLKIVIHNKMYIIGLQELKALPNLHLRVSKREVVDFKQKLLG